MRSATVILCSTVYVEFAIFWNATSHPSSESYKGQSVGCEVESSALISLTMNQKFTRTVSYHTQGEVIYWYFGQKEPLFSESRRFAKNMSKATGYKLDSNYADLDPAGYKDWALSKQNIPSLTIEVGKGSNPVDPVQFSTICSQNKDMLEEIISFE